MSEIINSVFERMTPCELDTLRSGLGQNYGGSSLEAWEAWHVHSLQRQAIKYGFTYRREKGRVIITPNDPPAANEK